MCLSHNTTGDFPQFLLFHFLNISKMSIYYNFLVKKTNQSYSLDQYVLTV